MRLYLDQMLRVELASLLREAGHDVVRAEEIGQSRADDALILQRAVQEGRTLVTIDDHFGDWVVLPLSEHYGVIRVEAQPRTATDAALQNWAAAGLRVASTNVHWLSAHENPSLQTSESL